MSIATSGTTTIRMARKLHEAANTLARIEEYLEANSYDVSYDADPDLAYDQRNYVSVSYGWNGLEFLCDGPRAAELMTELRRWIGGTWEKDPNESQFRLTRRTDYSGLRMEIVVNRASICEKRTVTKSVTIAAKPADLDRAERLRQRAADLAAEAEGLMSDQPERTVVQDVDEWECNPLLGD